MCCARGFPVVLEAGKLERMERMCVLVWFAIATEVDTSMIIHRDCHAVKFVQKYEMTKRVSRVNVGLWKNSVFSIWRL